MKIKEKLLQKMSAQCGTQITEINLISWDMIEPYIDELESIPIEPPVKPAKAIEWKETRWTTDGYVNNIKLFSIAYEGIIKRDKNPYNLTSRLPQLKAVEVESIDEGKNKAQELLNKYIKLLSV
jgi:hypothetical protein